MLAGSSHKRQQLVPQCTPVSDSPSWADAVQKETSSSPPPPATTAVTSAAATADFLALHERCITNGLKARINISNTAGHQEISIIVMCQPPSPQPRDGAADALVDAVWLPMLQCIRRPEHLRSGLSPRRPNCLRLNHRHPRPRRPHRLRLRSGQERRQKDAARWSC